MNVSAVVRGRVVDPSLDSGAWFVQTEEGENYSLRDLVSPVATEGERVLVIVVYDDSGLPESAPPA